MSETLTVPSPAQLAKECRELNELEQVMARSNPVAPPPLEHRFTHDSDGNVNLYSRTIFMPKGLLCTSKIHKTEHQYVVSKGVLKVWSEEMGWELIRAPFIGITKPGARRALHIIEDTVWTTFHPTTLTDLKEIEAALIEPHQIPQ
jgi:hypothetical protein